MEHLHRRYVLVGDSTVADGVPDEHPLTGWGAALPALLAAPVSNLAVAGARTVSFFENGWWDEVVRDLGPGVTVLLQFGHNDQKEPDTLAPREGFTVQLRRMVQEVRARGAEAVLCTPVERRWFDGDRLLATHGDYPNAVRDLSAELNAPLIDLTVFSSWLYESLGHEKSRELMSNFAPGEHEGWPEGRADDTHFQDRGARQVAAFVARSLRGIERLDGDQEPARVDLR